MILSDGYCPNISNFSDVKKNSLFGMIVKDFSFSLEVKLAEHDTDADFLNCLVIGPSTVDPSIE